MLPSNSLSEFITVKPIKNWNFDCLAVYFFITSYELTQLALQVLQAEPDPSVSFNCEYIDARSNEECQNYHHVLQLPQGPGTINNVPLNQTVLTCGSNAFSPHCYYRRVSPPPPPPPPPNKILSVLHIAVYMCLILV